MLEPGVIGSWLTLFISALESYGVDSKEFFSKRGINLENASDPQYRIAVATVNNLWQEAVDEVGDPCFGLKAGSFVTPNTLSALGMALWSARTIKGQLECFVRYYQFIAKINRVHMEERDGMIISVSDILPGADGKESIPEWAQDAVCAMMHTIRRALYKHDFSPIKMELVRSEPASPLFYEEFFGCPVTYGHQQIRIYISMEDATAIIPGSSDHVAAATEKLLGEFVLQNESATDLLGQLKRVLTVLLPQGRATMEQVSDELNTSRRTFHRKLEERGTSFREQVEEFRCELAHRYMSQDELSLGDIGFLLGFSSNSSFTRAFKRWTGQTPQEYRR